jgi:hypothetical protein
MEADARRQLRPPLDIGLKQDDGPLKVPAVALQLTWPLEQFGTVRFWPHTIRSMHERQTDNDYGTPRGFLASARSYSSSSARRRSDSARTAELAS